VENIRLSGGVTSVPDIQTTYTYTSDTTSQYYDLTNGLAYWGIVTQNSGTGDIKTTYDLNNDDHYFGVQKLVQSYSKTGGGPVASKKYTYTATPFGYTGALWYTTKITKTEDMRDNVTAISGTPDNGFNATNGLPYFAYAINSDGTALVTTKTFAFESKTGMGPSGANMLIPVASTKTYKVPNFAYTCNLSGATLVKASYVVWSNESGVWHPKATYSWKSDMDVNGNPISTFYGFDEGNPTANGWQLTGTIDKYGSYGNILQASDALGVPNCTIYRDDIGAPAMVAADARYGECLFSNYEVNGIADYQGSVALSTTPADLHFAPKTIKITRSGSTDQYARTMLTSLQTDCGSLGGKTIFWEFWAKADRATTSFTTLQTETGQWLITKYFNLTTTWQRFSFTYTIPANITDKQYRVVVRPPYAEGGSYLDGTIYFDDIRA